MNGFFTEFAAQAQDVHQVCATTNKTVLSLGCTGDYRVLERDPVLRTQKVLFGGESTEYDVAKQHVQDALLAYLSQQDFTYWSHRICVGMPDTPESYFFGERSVVTTNGTTFVWTHSADMTNELDVLLSHASDVHVLRGPRWERVSDDVAEDVYLGATARWGLPEMECRLHRQCFVVRQHVTDPNPIIPRLARYLLGRALQ